MLDLRFVQFASALLSLLACGSVDETQLYADPQIRAISTPIKERVGIDELNRMKAYVNSLVKPETISYSVYMGGDEFDCVFVERQPNIERMRDNGEDVTAILEGLTHQHPEELRVEGDPLSRAGVGPSSREGSAETSASNKASNEPPLEATQPVEEFCPLGTIPVRRIPLDEVVAFDTLDQYLESRFTPPVAGSQRDWARAKRTLPTFTFGMRSYVNVWSPNNRPPGDQTVSQLWLARGSGNGVDYETVETGWRVNGNDPLARLFAFFTNSNYTVGTSNCASQYCTCFSFQCGFAQTDNTVFLDGHFSNYSVAGGAQYEARFSLLKIYDSDNWHMMYGTKWVGLWLHEYFDSAGLADHGVNPKWGGEVYDSHQGPNHTTTDMGGDGTFGSTYSYGHVAYHRNLETIDTRPNGSYSFVTPFVSAEITRSECYDSVTGAGDPTWATYVYFGGTGRSVSQCITLSP